jgi:hypothetical protein
MSTCSLLWFVKRVGPDLGWVSDQIACALRYLCGIRLYSLDIINRAAPVDRRQNTITVAPVMALQSSWGRRCDTQAPMRVLLDSDITVPLGTIRGNKSK